MGSVEVESSDVIKLMIQFLKENGLLSTLRALQEETQVTLNTVDNVDRFAADILHGKWDAVLEVTANLRLPTAKLIDLYEQIVLELAEIRELDTARALMRQTVAMNHLKKEHPDRYLRLEHILQRTYFDHSEAYPNGSSKERRRQHIAHALQSEVVVVPPSRLLALLGQSLKWQQHQGLLPKGTKYDLFRGTAPVEVSEEEKPPTKNTKIIKFGKKSHPEVARFSPDGQYLVSGSSDGFVEVWDFDSGKLCKDLKYQAEDDFMMHEDSVHTMDFSRDSELLATGAANGQIKIWRIQTGSCVRKFTSAHTGSVSSVEFAKDGTQILSASFDQTVRIHGLKSGRMIKEFRGHKSYVNAATYSEDGSQVISASSDGTVKVWDAKTTDCLHTFTPGQTTQTISVMGVSRVHKHADRILVCNRSPALRVTTMNGQVLSSFPIAKGDITNYCVSPKGDWLYAVGEGGILYSFAVDGAKLESAIQLHKKDTLGIAHHPHRNIGVVE